MPVDPNIRQTGIATENTERTKTPRPWTLPVSLLLFAFLVFFVAIPFAGIELPHAMPDELDTPVDAFVAKLTELGYAPNPGASPELLDRLESENGWKFPEAVRRY